jgi:hypothetical protein
MPKSPPQILNYDVVINLKIVKDQLMTPVQDAHYIEDLSLRQARAVAREAYELWQMHRANPEQAVYLGLPNGGGLYYLPGTTMSIEINPDLR